MKNKNIIVVFGATGNLGAYSVVDLISKGYEIIAVGRRITDNGFFNSIGATYMSVDLNDKESFKKLPQKGVLGIVHFAGSLPSRYEYNPTELLESIVLGTENVLEYMIEVGAERIVFPQTPFDVYYKHNTSEIIDADTQRAFPLTGDHSIYTIAKNAAVNLIQHYHATYGIKYYILRFFTIYQYHPNSYHFADGVNKKMPYRILIDKALASEAISIWGDPTLKKEIVYVKDFTQIVCNCFSTTYEGGIYNVGNELGVSLEEQVRGIVDIFSPLGKPSLISYDPSKPSALQAKFDISKTVKELNYKQKYTYLEAMVDFYKEMQTEPFALLWGTKEDYE